MQLIRYYRNPYSIWISSTLNHKLRLKIHTTSIHLGEYSTTFLSVDIVVYNYAFFEDHQSILHALPPHVVESTCALQVFFYSHNSFVQHQILIWGFYNSHILLSIFNYHVDTLHFMMNFQDTNYYIEGLPTMSNLCTIPQQGWKLMGKVKFTMLALLRIFQI